MDFSNDLSVVATQSLCFRPRLDPASPTLNRSAPGKRARASLLAAHLNLADHRRSSRNWANVASACTTAEKRLLSTLLWTRGVRQKASLVRAPLSVARR